MEKDSFLIRFTLLFLVLTTPNGGCDAGVLTIAGTFIGIAELGLSIIEFIDGHGTSDTLDQNDMLSALNHRIKDSTTDIITSNIFHGKLERIDDTVIAVHSSLIDLRNALQAVLEDERSEYIRLFESRFEENHVIKHVRFLPELLEYTIPGSGGKLVDLLADNTRCNMSAIYEFINFYKELLSDGISLEIAYLSYKTNLNLNSTLKEWDTKYEKIKRIFIIKEDQCKTKFSVYVKEDVKMAVDATYLQTNNDLRYPWLANDVLFLKDYGTFQFLYIKYDEIRSFWSGHGKNKIAVFYDKDTVKRSTDILESGKDKIRDAIKGSDDKNAARHVGEAIEAHLNDHNINIWTMVVFFNGGTFTSEKLVFSEDSPSLQISLDNIELHYCYKSVFQCTADVKNWFGGKEELKGRMTAIVYVTESTGNDFIIGSGCINIPNVIFLLCVAILIAIL